MTKEKEIGKRIVEYRAKEGISQNEMGKRCGLTGQTIMNLEHGKSTSRMTTISKVNAVIGGKE